MENKELLEFLEKEMSYGISNINIDSIGEKDINYQDVQNWYFRTEKVIRVIDSLLKINSYPAINQLRYAGHHIIKVAALDPNIEANQLNIHRNLVEAYKHCKRAYFDTLDIYIYQLKMLFTQQTYAESKEGAEVEARLKQHIEEIVTIRLTQKQRIDFYGGIENIIVNGLTIVEDIKNLERLNKECEEKLKSAQIKIMSQSRDLSEKQIEINTLSKSLNSKYFFVAILIALILAFGTMLGAFGGWGKKGGPDYQLQERTINEHTNPTNSTR